MNAHIVHRLNRKRAFLRLFGRLAPWGIAIGFIAAYGFMAWMGRP